VDPYPEHPSPYAYEYGVQVIIKMFLQLIPENEM
jgi:hypothetical protein